MKRLVVALVALPLCVCSLALFDPPYPSTPAHVRADAALVLSGDLDYLRLRRAAELFRAREVSFLLLTGQGIGGDSADTMRGIAVRMGVPPDSIVVEDRSTTTRENLAFAAPILRARGWKRVALVTSISQMGRAERVARRAVPEVEWVPVAVPDVGPAGAIYRNRLAEWAKIAWYAVRGWL